MNEYMIIVNFISGFTEEFVGLIPEQRAQINRLMEKGIQTSYSLTADRSTLWLTLLATSTEAVRQTMKTMPLYPFMQFEIAELMFHNSPVYAPMRFSLN